MRVKLGIALFVLGLALAVLPAFGVDEETALKATQTKASELLGWRADSVVYFACHSSPNDVYSDEVSGTAKREIQEIHNIVNGDEDQEPSQGRNPVGEVAQTQRRSRMNDEVQDALRHCSRANTLSGSLRAANKKQLTDLGIHSLVLECTSGSVPGLNRALNRNVDLREWPLIDRQSIVDRPFNCIMTKLGA